MPRSEKLFDMVRDVTEGRYIKESSNEWNNLETDIVALKQRLMDKIDKADPKFDAVFNAFEALLASVTTANRTEGEGEVEDLSPGLEDAPIMDAPPVEGGEGDAANAEGAGGPIPVEDEEEDENPDEKTFESILSEKDDKDKKDEWKDERTHDDAVKGIVRDTWKELFADGKFKGDKEPTREEVMAEVEFQTKHGLDHRQDASAVKYDAYKKVMKKVKNIQKKLDAESNETPEEEDADAKGKFEAPSSFIGMKEYKDRLAKVKK